MSAQLVRQQLLTVSDVMATLRIGRTKVYRLFNEGQLQWVQVGAHRRVTESELNRYITAHTQVAS